MWLGASSRVAFPLAKTEASQQKMLAQEAGGKEDYPHALRYQGSLKRRGNQKR